MDPICSFSGFTLRKHCVEFQFVGIYGSGAVFFRKRTSLAVKRHGKEASEREQKEKLVAPPPLACFAFDNTSQPYYTSGLTHSSTPTPFILPQKESHPVPLYKWSSTNGSGSNTPRSSLWNLLAKTRPVGDPEMLAKQLRRRLLVHRAQLSSSNNLTIPSDPIEQEEDWST